LIQPTTILGWRAVYDFVRCLLCEILYLDHSLVAEALCIHYFGQNSAWLSAVSTSKVFEWINHKHQNTGAGHIFILPMPSASIYLNPHISAESWRMKKTKWPRIMLTSRIFYFPVSNIYFCFHLHLQLSWWRH